MKNTIYIIIILLISEFLGAQDLKTERIAMPVIKLEFAFQKPGGDMAVRFGNNGSVGASFLFKAKSNFMYGYDYSFFFSDNVREDYVLDNVKTYNGEIINQLGKFADVIINERGFFTGPQVGYVMPFKKPNPNSGIFILTSAGLLQHKINIENKNEDAPQILGDYLKGYDRLTNGFALKEMIGYMFFDNNQKINFFAGFEFYQGWTQSRRAFDYYSMAKDTKKRKDYLFGFKFGWVIPLYKSIDNSFYYY